MLKTIGLYVVAAGTIFAMGYTTCLWRGAEKVIKHKDKEAVGVNLLHKGEMKDAIRTVKVVQYIKTAPDITKCGNVRMRDTDVINLGGLRDKNR